MRGAHAPLDRLEGDGSRPPIVPGPVRRRPPVVGADRRGGLPRRRRATAARRRSRPRRAPPRQSRIALVEDRHAEGGEPLAEQQLHASSGRRVPGRSVEDHDVDRRQVPLELDQQLLPRQLRRRSRQRDRELTYVGVDREGAAGRQGRHAAIEAGGPPQRSRVDGPITEPTPCRASGPSSAGAGRRRIAVGASTDTTWPALRGPVDCPTRSRVERRSCGRGPRVGDAAVRTEISA